MSKSLLKRLPFGLIALLASSALVACGGDDSSSSPESVAEEFSKSFANGDGETACGLIESATAEALEQQGDSCAAAITKLNGLLSEEEKTAIEGATYELASEDGSSATVDVDLGDESDTMDLTQEDGEWKVTDPGS